MKLCPYNRKQTVCLRYSEYRLHIKYRTKPYHWLYKNELKNKNIPNEPKMITLLWDSYTYQTRSFENAKSSKPVIPKNYLIA